MLYQFDTISIHAPPEGSDGFGLFDAKLCGISIHAPPEGSDVDGLGGVAQNPAFQSTLPPRGATLLPPPSLCVGVDFNPRSPRGERLHSAINPHKRKEFQSTLPPRGATSCAAERSPRITYFNPRSPRGERPVFHVVDERFRPISIHAPPEGSDNTVLREAMEDYVFQSTLPPRGATSGQRRGFGR